MAEQQKSYVVVKPKGELDNVFRTIKNDFDSSKNFLIGYDVGSEHWTKIAIEDLNSLETTIANRVKYNLHIIRTDSASNALASSQTYNGSEQKEVYVYMPNQNVDTDSTPEFVGEIVTNISSPKGKDLILDTESGDKEVKVRGTAHITEDLIVDRVIKSSLPNSGYRVLGSLDFEDGKCVGGFVSPDDVTVENGIVTVKGLSSDEIIGWKPIVIGAFGNYEGYSPTRVLEFNELTADTQYYTYDSLKNTYNIVNQTIDKPKDKKIYSLYQVDKGDSDVDKPQEDEKDYLEVNGDIEGTDQEDLTLAMESSDIDTVIGAIISCEDEKVEEPQEPVEVKYRKMTKAEVLEKVKVGNIPNLVFSDPTEIVENNTIEYSIDWTVEYSYSMKIKLYYKEDGAYVLNYYTVQGTYKDQAQDVHGHTVEDLTSDITSQVRTSIISHIKSELSALLTRDTYYEGLSFVEAPTPYSFGNTYYTLSGNTYTPINISNYNPLVQYYLQSGQSPITLTGNSKVAAVDDSTCQFSLRLVSGSTVIGSYCISLMQ